MKRTLNILFAGLIFFTLSAAAQTPAVSGTSSIQSGYGYRFAYTTEKPVKGAPYSAEATTENVRVLGDGNKITRTTKTLLYRDGEGRTRREETVKPIGVFSFMMMETIVIFDPTAGYRYYVNPTNKTARRTAIPPQKPTNPPPANISSYVFSGQGFIATASGNFTVENYTQSASTGYSTKSEDLSPRTIEGVETTGKSSTTTIAAGTIGNERDIVTTSETWYSKDLQTIVLNKRNDPQTGNYTYQLTNIKRSEPDKSLFTIPADYKIVDNPVLSGTTVVTVPKSN